MTTPRELIKAALELGGVIDPIEDIDADEVTGLFSRLNRMISAWSNQSALIFADTELSHVLTANDGEYTMGTGGDIATRPKKIKSAFTRDSGNIDVPLKIIDEYEWASVRDKTTSSDRPKYLYFKEGFPTATIRLIGVPSAAYTLHLLVTAPLTQFASLDTSISLPEGYEEAIEYNFWKRICTIYGKSLTLEQNDIADTGLKLIKNSNRQNDRYESTISFPGHGYGYFDLTSREDI